MILCIQGSLSFILSFPMLTYFFVSKLGFDAGGAST
jgi:hypothetical protein